MTALRAAAAAGAVVLAMVLQVSLFPHLAWQGVVPNLVLLVVVAVALTRDPQLALVTGFLAGALLDLAPPADHVAGRWALALTVVAYVACRVRPETRASALTVVSTVAACSFVGTSLYALTGLVLGDGVGSAGELLQVVALSLVWDVVLTPFVLPPLLALFTRLEPARMG
ncbi:rod shape-determining protein MreD [Nocardioides acrostichi]|uniref:Rod shape-determining protein MreD n=1 Tax=Nocardioides acrostichi TaxID=2784339 RepID=A0A930UXQ5_9ACTN|nr:rod shape-determining protein MreD [Nocardioides acrostichi]MBF4160319.1 rod shape-determining protein MreD [Nocardioides acrostichi]